MASGGPICFDPAAGWRITCRPSNAQLGIAIGDVSGKGIPASLLMATLRAYLRGAQTIHHQADLTAVMRNLNTLVYESSDANRYATFFYGELDLASRVLTYTDGVSEAMNAADEEWGEERLMDAVEPSRASTARAVIDSLMTAADGFAAGAPQHDDMTLLVVRAI